MKIKRYKKYELACMYFPEASEPKVALNHLRSWIKGCPELTASLKQVKMLKTKNEYNEKEVALIYEMLGEPEKNGI